MNVTTPTDLAVAPTVQRLTWLTELMGRFAAEQSDGHDSTRLAAAILIHLRSLRSELLDGQGLASTAEHWIDNWEKVLERAASRKPLRDSASASPAVSLHSLITQARAF